MNTPSLTILTCTYNRCELLKKCYTSLCNQTNKDFEWLIVDDGSTDNTKVLIDELVQKSDFKINYFYKNNGGKHTALNFSHNYINSELLLILDSDDTITEDAVDTIISKWQQYKNNNKIWCLSFLRGSTVDKPLCEYDSDIDIESNHIDCRINKCILGDCAEVIRSEVFCKYNFPEFQNEKFIGEDCLWITMAYSYNTVYINKIIYICNYLNDGLTKSGRTMRIKNPLGGMYRCNLYLTKNIILKERLKKAILFDSFAFAHGNAFANIHNNNNPLLCHLMHPLGYLLSKHWVK